MIAGIGRRNRPNCPLLWTPQKYSTKGWVYREGQGWVFAELTPDELAEFRLYQCGIPNYTSDGSVASLWLCHYV